MFNSETLEIVIGLIFSYLLLALLVTTLNEAISSGFNLRGRHLRWGLQKMLGKQVEKLLTEHPHFIQAQRKQWLPVMGKVTRHPSYFKASEFARAFTQILRGKEYETVEASKAAENETTAASKAPDDGRSHEQSKSSLGAGNSQNSLVDNICKAEYKLAGNDRSLHISPENIEDTIKRFAPSKEAEAIFLGLWNQANHNIKEFEINLANWYDDHMVRVRGWYTQWMRFITIGLAIGITVAFNADTFFIVQKLSHDSTARQQIVKDANTWIAQSGPIIDQLAAKAQQESDPAQNPTLKPAQNPTPDPAQNPTQEPAPDPAPSENPSESNGTGANNTTATPNDANPSAATPAAAPASQDDSTAFKAFEALVRRSDSLSRDNAKYLQATLGMGWNAQNHPSNPDYCNCNAFTCWLKKILGWLITAFAISLGAPFWFDLLKRVTSIRASGVNPDESGKKTK